MKIILTADVDTLGNAGDVVEVKDGYARNFLLPRSVALIANERNMAVYEKVLLDTAITSQCVSRYQSGKKPTSLV